MGSEIPENDILEQFRATSSKLKKRFLRKPNVTEACESFSHLGQLCEKSELPTYAGMCWIAAARCEGSLGNIPGETSNLVRAGHQFWTAEEEERSLGYFSPGKENYEAGLSCYGNAANCHPEDIPIGVGLNLEIAEKCHKFDKENDAEAHLLKAVELSKDSLETRQFALEMLGSHYVERGIYTEALDIYSKLIETLDNLPKNGARSQSSLQYEICCVLLLLIVHMGPQKLTPSQAKLLEKYTWGEYDDKTCRMTEKKFILMQSLVASCQSLDITNLQYLENDLYPLLEEQGRKLLRVLVKMYFK